MDNGLIGKFFSILCVVSNEFFSIYFSVISFLRNHVSSLLKNNIFGLLERMLNIRVWKFDIVDSGCLIL